MTQTPIDLPYSAACERNQAPILQVISPYLEKATSVLEVGTGTAQHALYFAQRYPNLRWQTADQSHYLPGINAQLLNARLDNVSVPIELDVNQKNWGFNGQAFDVIYTSNTLHIMSIEDVNAFFNGLSAVAQKETILIIYGPFKYSGAFTSESNQEFDQSLRERGEGSCIKEFNEIERLANQQGFKLLNDYAMPANNQCLIWSYE